MTDGLVAHSRADDGAGTPSRPPDLVFLGPDVELRGWGIARRIPVGVGPDRLLAAARDVEAALAAIDHRVDGDLVGPGIGPLAIGALPFADDHPGELVVPEVVVGRSARGARWTTIVGNAGEASGAAAPLPPPGSRATGTPSRRVRSVRTTEAWCAAVAAAAAAVGDGAATKVVLAREVLVEGPPLDLAALLDRLSAAYPGAYRFLVSGPGPGHGFLGASPELLVARAGEEVRAQPMAGTVPRQTDRQADAAALDALASSAGLAHEHRITIDAVLDGLLAYCSYVDADAEPIVVELANVAHLATTVRGRLSDPPPSALRLVAALHPTPAVGGWPRSEALALIDQLEGMDRRRYAGPVGWVDAAGNGTFAVGIRSAELDADGLHVYAGNGIVVGADPAAELAENQAKLRALLDAIAARPD